MGDELAAEDPAETAGFVDHFERVVTPRRENEGVEQAVERGQGRPVQDVVAVAGHLERPYQIRRSWAPSRRARSDSRRCSGVTTGVSAGR